MIKGVVEGDVCCLGCFLDHRVKVGCDGLVFDSTFLPYCFILN